MEKSKLTNNVSGHIFSEIILSVPNCLLAELPREKHLKRTIHNHWAYNDPHKPSCILVIIIEGTYLFIIYKVLSQLLIFSRISYLLHKIRLPNIKCKNY